MAGFNIGIGIGIRYDTDIEKKFIGDITPSILNAILLESEEPIMMEDESYLELESSNAKNAKEAPSAKNYSNYWNDLLLM